jgi:cytoskeletal protein RodZ
MTPPVVPMQKSGTVVDARMSLAMWLRGGRSQRNMSLEDVARITKIQVRILERLEAGTIKPGDGMPAEVFVRGFVRSIAKCVGLDEAEALRRYSEAAAQAALDPSPVTAGPSARAFVESMSELAPSAARTSSPRLLDNAPALAAGSGVDLQAAPMIEVVEIETAPVETASAEIAPIATEQSADGKKKSKKKATGKGRKRKAIATGTPFDAMPVVAQPIETTEIAAAIAVDPTEIASELAAPIDVAIEVEVAPAEIVEPGETWAPKMPVVVAPTVPWRINASARSHARSKASTGRIVPSLVIDDSDPDLAERELEDRAAATRSMEPAAASRSFLPSILRDREDRSARQGGLTLAVIILLIAATLTLSYLMRRPSSSGDGVTQADLVESVDQLA